MKEYDISFPFLAFNISNIVMSICSKVKIAVLRAEDVQCLIQSATGLRAERPGFVSMQAPRDFSHL
jgi:hypothetical protein